MCRHICDALDNQIALNDTSNKLYYSVLVLPIWSIPGNKKWSPNDYLVSNLTQNVQHSCVPLPRAVIQPLRNSLPTGISFHEEQRIICLQSMYRRNGKHHFICDMCFSEDTTSLSISELESLMILSLHSQ